MEPETGCFEPLHWSLRQPALGPPVPLEPATFSGGQMAAGASVLDPVGHLEVGLPP